MNIYIICLDVCVFANDNDNASSTCSPKQLNNIENNQMNALRFRDFKLYTSVYGKKYIPTWITNPQLRRPIDYYVRQLLKTLSRHFRFSLLLKIYIPPRELKSQTAWRSLDTDWLSLSLPPLAHPLSLSLTHLLRRDCQVIAKINMYRVFGAKNTWDQPRKACFELCLLGVSLFLTFFLAFFYEF